MSVPTYRLTQRPTEPTTGLSFWPVLVVVGLVVGGLATWALFRWAPQ